MNTTLLRKLRFEAACRYCLVTYYNSAGPFYTCTNSVHFWSTYEKARKAITTFRCEYIANAIESRRFWRDIAKLYHESQRLNPYGVFGSQ